MEYIGYILLVMMILPQHLLINGSCENVYYLYILEKTLSQLVNFS